MRRTLLALLIFVQFSLTAATRTRPVHAPPAVVPAAIVTAAHQAAEAALKAGVPAVQIAVSRGGQIIYSEAFGVTDVGSATPATSRSPMQMGSVTKQFTAAAILRLAERGALTLDDRIETFVPEFDPRGRTITVRNLLNHTSGMSRDWYPPDVPADTTSPVTREHVIKNMNERPFLFATGKGFSYSNAGYMLLGYAIESITGGPYADFIHSEFAVPLGLLDTGVCGTHNLPVPAGYAVSAPLNKPIPMPPWHWSWKISEGSLCSTAFDLARWSHFLGTGVVLQPASYATMKTPLPPATPYAFGIVSEKILGRPAVWHDGAVFGFITYLVYFSTDDVAVAVHMNTFPAPAGVSVEGVALAVAKAALNPQ
ncbi:MAG TPA: serine hydrolase domain-containing protein [Thermoanaerobaculia bacterium]|jgi:CubicO group peptidase (beta-lactamase class C family)